MVCSGLNVVTAESGLESCHFIAVCWYSRDFRKEETGNNDVEVSPLLGE